MTRLLIISTIILSSCNYINTDKKRVDKVESLKNYFYDNQDNFEQIVEQLETDKKLDNLIGRLLKPNDLDDLTNKKLKGLGIKFVSISNTNCNDKEVEFMTTWTEYPIGQMYLTKTGCNETKSTKGNYWTDTKFIEVWGLGDGWIIWTDSDFI